MRILLAMTIAAVFAAGCGNKTSSGACKDYRPVDRCDDDHVYVCETNDEGCEQCGCVPVEDANYYGHTR